MNRLISMRNPALFPKTAIGKQECGVIFWQKTGFLTHCSQKRFKAIIDAVTEKFSPTNIARQGDRSYFLTFGGNENEVIYLTLKPKDTGNHSYVYGESGTVYAGKAFHLFALDVAGFIAKHVGCRFYIDDATGYVDHHSEEQLEKYIVEYQKHIDSITSQYEWKRKATGTRGNIELYGVDIFQYEWQSMDIPLHVDDSPVQPNTFYIRINGKPHAFAARKTNGDTWEFFVQELVR